HLRNEVVLRVVGPGDAIGQHGDGDSLPPDLRREETEGELPVAVEDRRPEAAHGSGLRPRVPAEGEAHEGTLGETGEKDEAGFQKGERRGPSGDAEQEVHRLRTRVEPDARARLAA